VNRIPLGLRLAALCLLTICRPAISQDYLTATGNPSFSVNIPVENGFINVANGNLHMEFPLATHKQRGALTLDEKLVYDSRIWMIGHYSNYYWWPTNVPNTTQAQGGWRFVTGAETGTLTYTLNSGSTQGTCQAPNRGPTGTQDNNVSTISWSDPNGTNHIFNAWLIDDENTCGYPTSRTIDGGYATDASGYYVRGDSNGNAVVLDKNGTQVYPEVIDRYGNYWSLDNNENLIDDIGRTPVIATTSGNITYYDVLAPNGPINNNGKRVRYTVTTTPIQVSTQFNETGVVEWSGTLSPVTSIQLPDGSSYSFSYDSYGEMKSVTLPTGGVITYGWGNYFDSYQNVNRWLTSRTVGNNPAMTFTPSVITQCSSGGTGCQEQMIVHKPSGDETVYALTLNNGAWNTNTTAYTGSHSSGTPLMNVVNTYDFSNPCPNQICIGANDITKSNSVTTLSDTGLMTQTQYGYTDPYTGNLTSLKQWGYYTGSPSATPTHETDYVYTGYDLTQTTGFYNGTQVAQTTYGYVSSATTTSGIAQHGTTNAGGPYLQAISKWINTGGSSTTTYTMDDTGMVTAIKDPKGNPSSTSYQCANALLYQTTNALSQTTTYGYDCNSGAITSVKDPNDLAAGRAGTTYTYEAVAGRPWTIGRPDGGTTTYTYPSSTEVDTAITATPDPTISSQDISDAFGRAYQHTQAGVSTETTYDANGRILCVTNPHLTGVSTDGSTCMTTYDGLDRPKVQTQQDSSTLKWSYNGSVTTKGIDTTSTDEAGNSWIRTSNAFGQLANVVEPGNLQTGYTYDGLGNLTSATQAGGTRSFVYDSLSRLTSETSPEAGTTGYSYIASGSLCAGDVTLPCSKTDAR
jgi:YD repeat-containing protein